MLTNFGAVDRLVATALMANYTDTLLVSKGPVRRWGLGKPALLAEHGLSLYIEAYTGNRHHIYLMDTGYTPVALPFNLERMEIDLTGIKAVVVSHGHR
jgi:metal-dependent hydrolase (beta-lactamase superfamily II)